jgi:methylmalonyl-CoA mutase cobalamin-binding subunit
MAAAVSVRRRRRSVVIVVGDVPAGDASARALTRSLDEAGVEATYLGRGDDMAHVAAVVCEQGADTVELCLGPVGGVVVLRRLLRELTEAGRREVSIVVHRIP